MGQVDFKHIVSFSGGKDSTAMLFMMIEKGMQIDEVIHFSMGDWEWDEMHKHIEKVRKELPKNLKFTVLQDEERKQSDFKKYGFASFHVRWCTGIKEQTINKYLKKKYDEYILYIGIASDEAERTEKKYTKKFNVKFPLIDWGTTEAEALEYCYEKGFDWNKLYENKPSKRLSCWCCPLQKMDDLRYLYTTHYDKWQILREMQRKSFQPLDTSVNSTVFYIEHKFWLEGLGTSEKIWKPKQKQQRISLFSKELM